MSNPQDTEARNDAEGRPAGLQSRLRALYYGEDEAASRFRFVLIAFDVITVLFFVVSSMVPERPWIFQVDLALAAVLLVEFAARCVIANRSWRFLLSFPALVDLAVIASLLAPAFLENLAFLRVVRMLRLLRSYHLLRGLRRDWPWFRQREDLIQSSLNLAVFVFIVTAIVFVLEEDRNASINNYFDALYFTVTTLTTTGFGDITLTDTAGRAFAVVIMVFGVALFLRLVQTIFRPPKVACPCSHCGLRRHDPDAVHCKHCGAVVNIPTEGDWT